MANRSRITDHWWTWAGTFWGKEDASLVTWVTNAIHLTWTDVALGWTLTEITIVDWDVNTYPISFIDLASFDVSNTDSNLTRGNFSLFNDVSSPILGQDAVWHSHVSWTIIHWSYTDATNTRLIWNDSSTWVINQIRVNPTASSLVSQTATKNYWVTANHVLGYARLNWADWSDLTFVETTEDYVNIEANDRELRLNDWTTASGTWTATVWMVPVLQNATTWAVKYGTTPINTFWVGIWTATSTVFAIWAAIWSTFDIPYTVTEKAAPEFTLAANIITCNTAWTYEIEYKTNPVTATNGAYLACSHDILVNWVANANSRSVTTHEANSSARLGSRTFTVTLAPWDTIVNRITKISTAWWSRALIIWGRICSLYITKVS